MPTKERAVRTQKHHIYAVTVNSATRLIRALSRAKAIKHVVHPIEAVIPSAEELVDLVKQEVEVEEAGE